MTRYSARKLSPIEELIKELEAMRDELRARRFDPDAADRRREKRIEALVVKSARTQTWQDIAQVMDLPTSEVRERYTPAVRRVLGTNRLSRRGPATAHPHLVVVGHQPVDGSVRAWVEPDATEWPGIGGYVVRHRWDGVLAADGAELLEVILGPGYLDLEQPDSIFELRRGLESAAAVADAAGQLRNFWSFPLRDELPYDEVDELYDLVETVTKLLGPDAGDHQASRLGFRVRTRLRGR